MAKYPNYRLGTANTIATITIIISTITSAASMYVSYRTSISVQNMQARDTDLKSLEDSAEKLQEAGAAYVGALNKGGDLTEPRDRIGAILARQAMTAINIKPKLKKSDEQYVDEYIGALKEFNNASRKISRPEDFNSWSAAYGRTVDTRSSLAQVISSNVGRRG